MTMCVYALSVKLFLTKITTYLQLKVMTGLKCHGTEVVENLMRIIKIE